jgi:hypothetical protein
MPMRDDRASRFHQQTGGHAMSLKGKVIVITSGGSGLGADAAKASRAAGASVVLPVDDGVTAGRNA